MRIRRHHVIGTGLIVLVALIIGIALGLFAGYSYPYKTLPKPPLPPGQKAPAPSCGKSGNVQLRGHNGSMGGCLPRPTATKAALITSTSQGCDLSNNDPVFGLAAWRLIAARTSWCVFKVRQGTYYFDPTAKSMTAYARAVGLVVGGYDFFDVCRGSATTEAQLFVSNLKYDGLTGPNTLPPTGDAEYPLGSVDCNVRDWIQSWADEVYRLTGIHPMIYTGAWWWQPHAGSYWVPFALAWISGYGVRYPFMPSGRSQLDIWQYTDAGYNGASSSDLSFWRDGAAAFIRASNGRPASAYLIFPYADPARHFVINGYSISERWTVIVWDQNKCRNPVIRLVCRGMHARMVLLQGRIFAIADHGHNLWGLNHYRERSLALGRRLSQH